MIYDKLKNIQLYKGIHKNLDVALNFIINEDISSLPYGRTSIQGDEVFVNIVEQMTHKIKKSKFEAHRRYADIHYLIKGHEVINIAEISTLKEVKPYNTDNDCLFFEGMPTSHNELLPTDFLVCFPTDAHIACVVYKKPETIRKAVIKVLVE